jgi:effector-binding domain-containing protein
MVHGVNYAMVKEEIAIDAGMQDWFSKAYGAIYSYCEEMGKAPLGPPCGFYYTWDMENNKTTAAAAVPLTKVEYEEGETVNLEGLGDATLRESHIMYNMVGSYSDTGFGAAHNALEKWCNDNGKTMVGPAMEEYVKGPGDQVAPEEYVTNIYYFFE